ncbi:MAG: hypothetical protein NVS9B11_10660 [Candidatus Dormibacteraceae bacterium]
MSVDVHVDVIPDRKVPCEPLVESGVGLLYAAKSLVREDDTEPKCVVGRIPLPDLDLVVTIEELDQGGQV